MLDIKLKLKPGHTRVREWMTPASLSKLYWNTTYACNLACPICFSDSGERASDELSTAEASEMLRQAGEIGISDIIISGGDADDDSLPDSAELHADSDGDGLPDLLDTDSDNDGFSDRAEFVAGTSTIDAGSQFSIVSAFPILGTNFVLHWNAVSGRVYSVYGTTNLVDGPIGELSQARYQPFRRERRRDADGHHALLRA